MMSDNAGPKDVMIDYTNWRGVRGIRRILPPFRIYWGSTEYHAEPQHLLEAVDTDKGKRTFAMKDIHSWIPLLEADA
jgi:hypothetical protein